MIYFSGLNNLTCNYKQLHGLVTDLEDHTYWGASPLNNFADIYTQDSKSFANEIRFSDCRRFADTFYFEEIRKLRKWFQEKYNVSIEAIAQIRKVQAGGSTYVLYPSSFSLQLGQLRDLKAQLSKVPSDFFQSYGLKTFVLCGRIDEIMADGSQIQGYRAAIPPADDKAYLFEIWPFYHELFHKMDYQNGGLPLMGVMTFQEYKKASQSNEEWKTLDPKDKKSLEAIDEEQAEYARILFNLNDPFIQKSQYEPKLSNPEKLAKLIKMKQWLYEWSGGRLDEQYWQVLAAGKVNETYWKQR